MRDDGTPERGDLRVVSTSTSPQDTKVLACLGDGGWLELRGITAVELRIPEGGHIWESSFKAIPLGGLNVVAHNATPPE